MQQEQARELKASPRDRRARLRAEQRERAAGQLEQAAATPRPSTKSESKAAALEAHVTESRFDTQEENKVQAEKADRKARKTRLSVSFASHEVIRYTKRDSEDAAVISGAEATEAAAVADEASGVSQTESAKGSDEKAWYEGLFDFGADEDARDRRARLRAEQRTRAAGRWEVPAAPRPRAVQEEKKQGLKETREEKEEETDGDEAKDEDVTEADSKLTEVSSQSRIATRWQLAAEKIKMQRALDRIEQDRHAAEEQAALERQEAELRSRFQASAAKAKHEAVKERLRQQAENELEVTHSRVKIGVRLQNAAGKVVHLEALEHLRQLWAVERYEMIGTMLGRLLKIASASLLEYLARLKRTRMIRQETYQAHWSTEIDILHSKKAARLLKRRASAVAEKTEHLVSSSAREAGEWLFKFKELVSVDSEQFSGAHGRSSPKGSRSPASSPRRGGESPQQQVEDLFKKAADDASAYKKQILKLQKFLLPYRAPEPRHRAALMGGTDEELQAGLAVEGELASDFREILKERIRHLRRSEQEDSRTPKDHELAKSIRQERAAAEASIAGQAGEIAEREKVHADGVQSVEERVKRAMDVLDVHQAKPVKIRVTGLRQSTIHDQDKFRHLVVEKFSEVLNVDEDQVRVKAVRGGSQ